LLSFMTTQAQSDNHKILSVTISNAIDGELSQSAGTDDGRYITKISTRMNPYTIGMRITSLTRQYSDVQLSIRWLKVNTELFDYACIIKFGSESFIIGYIEREKAVLVADEAEQTPIKTRGNL